MREFFHSIYFKIIIAMLALLLGIMIYVATSGGYSSEAAGLWERITSPFMTLSTNISDSIANSLDMLLNSEKYYNENIELKNRLNEAYNKLANYEDLMRENNDLRTMLELEQEYDNIQLSPTCDVISRVTNDPYFGFTINQGYENGIAPQDTVVTSEGIVGVCYDVAAKTAKVRTLYHPKTAIGAYTVRTRTTGIIEGGYTSENENDGIQCCMKYIDKEADIEVGDIVVTSGSENYPSGQLIGTITEIHIEDSGLSAYAIIQPAIDPTSVSKTFVITSFEGENIPTNLEETE